MPTTTTERGLLFLLRIALAWTFLYAASHQVFVSGFSIVGFLGSTKTFHGFFQIFTGGIRSPSAKISLASGL